MKGKGSPEIGRLAENDEIGNGRVDILTLVTNNRPLHEKLLNSILNNKIKEINQYQKNMVLFESYLKSIRTCRRLLRSDRENTSAIKKHNFFILRNAVYLILRCPFLNALPENDLANHSNVTKDKFRVYESNEKELLSTLKRFYEHSNPGQDVISYSLLDTCETLYDYCRNIISNIVDPFAEEFGKVNNEEIITSVSKIRCTFDLITGFRNDLEPDLVTDFIYWGVKCMYLPPDKHSKIGPSERLYYLFSVAGPREIPLDLRQINISDLDFSEIDNLGYVHLLLTKAQETQLPPHLKEQRFRYRECHLPLFNSEIKPILKSGASANCYNDDYQSPLHIAVTMRRVDRIECLLTKSKKININIINGCGKTALMLAVDLEYQECVNILLMNGAKVEPKTVKLACEKNNLALATLLRPEIIQVDFFTALYLNETHTIKAIITKQYYNDEDLTNSAILSMIDDYVTRASFDNADFLSEKMRQRGASASSKLDKWCIQNQYLLKRANARYASSDIKGAAQDYWQFLLDIGDSGQPCYLEAVQQLAKIHKKGIYYDEDPILIVVSIVHMIRHHHTKHIAKLLQVYGLEHLFSESPLGLKKSQTSLTFFSFFNGHEDPEYSIEMPMIYLRIVSGDESHFSKLTDRFLSALPADEEWINNVESVLAACNSKNSLLIPNFLQEHPLLMPRIKEFKNRMRPSQ